METTQSAQHTTNSVTVKIGEGLKILICKINAKEIWKAPVPNSVINFLWRLTRNILLTRANLAKKGMKVEPLCPLCNGGVKYQEHLFMHCQPAQLLWFTTKLGIHVPPFVSLNSWVLQRHKSPDHLATQFFCITFWKI